MDKIRNSEQGLGMLEFALILPVIIVIVAGLVDYGHVVRQMNTLSLIARDAARTAAAHSRTGRFMNNNPGEARVRCGNHLTEAVVCGAPAAGGLSPALTIKNYDAGDAANTPDSVTVAARKAACMGLQNAELDGDDFDVTPIIALDPETPAIATAWAPQELRLQIQLKKNAKSRKCLLCWGEMLAQVPMRGDSVFILEDRCDE